MVSWGHGLDFEYERRAVFRLPGLATQRKHCDDAMAVWLVGFSSTFEVSLANE
jgi:hypothetical protein